MNRRDLVVRRASVLCLMLFFPALARAEAVESKPTWIYWSPRWEATTLSAAPSISPRAAARLAREGRSRGGADPSSRPAPQGFLRYLREQGLEVRQVSRFLRAVSSNLDPGQRAALERDPNVARLAPVRVLRGEVEPIPEPAPMAAEMAPERVAPDPRTLDPESYGPSWTQLEQLGVQQLHERGFAGQGVWVCMLDAGTRTSHPALLSLSLAGQKDFVGHDALVEQGPGDSPGSDRHGTSTASVLAGFLRGGVIGPAYQADLFLARTEDVASETHVEEDNFVAAIEWADSLGVDVVSSSLGYVDFDDGSRYAPEDLDGRTAVTTRAAAWAVRRGIVVVTSAGNYGPQPGTIATPADAESVLSAGAVSIDGVPARFSSRGPTADGRVKPDLCARGVATVCAARDGATTLSDGTSFSAPLLAGLAALLRQAHPEWTAMQVVERLRSSGDQAEHPDNVRGWGIPDAFRAADLSGGSLVVEGVSWQDDASADPLPRPGSHGSVHVTLENAGADPSAPAWVSLLATGTAVVPGADSVRIELLAPGGTAEGVFSLHVARDAAPDTRLPLFARLAGDDDVVGHRRVPLRVAPAAPPPVERVLLEPLLENPLRAGTPLAVRFRVPGSGPITVRIYDAGGRLLATPFRDRIVNVSDTSLPPWQPSPDLASGSYWLRFETPWGTRHLRFAMIR